MRSLVYASDARSGWRESVPPDAFTDAVIRRYLARLSRDEIRIGHFSIVRPGGVVDDQKVLLEFLSHKPARHRLWVPLLV